MSNKASALDVLRQLLPLPAARVSSAHARGRARDYAYWGAVRYTVHESVDGRVVVTADECASSDRRSQRLAEADCDDLCDREGRVRVYGIGEVSNYTAARILERVPASDVADARRDAQYLSPLGVGLL